MQKSWRRHLAAVLPEAWQAGLSDELCFRLATDEGPVRWRALESHVDGDVLRETYAQEAGPLTLGAELRRLEAYGAFTARLTLANPSVQTGPPLRGIEPLRLATGLRDGHAEVRRAGGGLNEWIYPPEACRVETVRLCGRRGSLSIESGWDGRSSNRDLPFLMACADGAGAVTALEWSGLWRQTARFDRQGRFAMVAEIPVDGLTLEPGESLALPAAHCLFCDGGLGEVTNAWRRYLHERVIPPLGGRPPLPPLCYNTWFGIGPDITEGMMMRQADAAARLGMEYFVLDAGWYAGCPRGDFQPGVGNWEIVDDAKFPDGLTPLAERVRGRGMKFGLWFEIERAHRDSHWAREHPEWFWDVGGDYLHIDLGRADAREGVVRVIGEAVEHLGLEWVKLDYNIGPKPFWEGADPSGKAMFRYVDGLYAVLDALLERCPHVLWECCASGGRRIDLGTLRRAHTAWLSDHVGHPAICRFMQTGAARFLPGNIPGSAVPAGERGGVARLTDYEAASRMAGAFCLHGDVASWPAEARELARRMGELYLSYRHLLVEDFYALTPHPKRDDEWDVVEFCARDGSDAIVMAYSFLSEPREMIVRPRGLIPDARYAVQTALPSKGEAGERTGRELMDDGTPIALGPESAAFVRITAR